MEAIFNKSAEHLKVYLADKLSGLYSEGFLFETKDYLYAKGDAPYMLVAHLDTVHKQRPSIICYSKDGRYMMSPYGIGGDDRCGVYIIMTLLDALPFKPHVLFTMDEEVGGLGAREFCKDYKDVGDLKYIVEFDRKGNDDCVFYECDNRNFVEFVESLGFKEDFGSFSDISLVAPHLGVAAVNLSSGYFNPHTTHEYVDLVAMNEIIDKAFAMLTTDSDAFEYIERVYPKNSWDFLDNYGKDDVYYECEECGYLLSDKHIRSYFSEITGKEEYYVFCPCCQNTFLLDDGDYDEVDKL